MNYLFDADKKDLMRTVMTVEDMDTLTTNHKEKCYEVDFDRNVVQFRDAQQMVEVDIEDVREVANQVSTR